MRAVDRLPGDGGQARHGAPAHIRAGQRDPPQFGEIGQRLKPEGQRVGQRAAMIGPFDQHDAVAHRLVQTQFDQLVGMAQAIQVRVPDFGPLGVVIGLDQRKGGAGHVLGHVALAGADKGAGEMGLAGADRALQRDHVAGFHDRRHHPRQTGGQIGIGMVKRGKQGP